MSDDRRDVVFAFSFVTWDGAAQRGMTFAQDRLLQHLLADPRVGRVVVANSYRAAARRLARWALRRDQPFPSGEDAVLFSPLRLRRSDPASPDALDDAYERYDRGLRHCAQRLGVERPVVISAHPLLPAYAPLEWAGAVTFYATDDWTAHHGYAPLWPAFEEGYRRVRERGHRLVAVSQQIVDRVRPSGSARVIPNGVSPAEWLSIGRPAAWLEELPRPLLVYAGNLDERLDVDAVAAAAAAFPHGSIVLVGALADARHLAPLAGHSNVHVRPPVRRAEVPALVAAADVGLIPHRRTPLTAAMSPLKLYEYLAAGRPVAAVDLAPIRAVASARVALVGEGEGFADGVGRALEIGPMAEDERRAFVAANSWSRRHEELLDLALAAS